jgi:hypothetical protein
MPQRVPGGTGEGRPVLEEKDVLALETPTLAELPRLWEAFDQRPVSAGHLVGGLRTDVLGGEEAQGDCTVHPIDLFLMDGRLAGEVRTTVTAQGALVIPAKCLGPTGGVGEKLQATGTLEDDGHGVTSHPSYYGTAA